MNQMFYFASATTGYARTQEDADRFNASSDKPAGLNFVVYVLATDDDFSGTTDGSFQYIGTDEYVRIPNVIKGVPVTSYNTMFATNSVIKGVASSNTNVTDMSLMLRGTTATELDLNNLNTSGVTNMSYMFYGSLATTLDLSSFDTSNVTNMRQMFQNSAATGLDLSSFDTSNVTNMSGMFYNSPATALDLSNFDTSSVTDMSNMFQRSDATTLDLSSFDTANVTNMNAMFDSSVATTGYARTQADADKFNASSLKPAGLTFIVKP
jgi:surface protein